MALRTVEFSFPFRRRDAPKKLRDATAARDLRWRKRCAAQFVHGIADDGEAAVANSIETAPSRALGEYVKIILSRRRSGTLQKRESPAEGGPLLRGSFEASLARSRRWRWRPARRMRVGNKSSLADGDQRIRPNNEENAARRQTAQALLKLGKVMFEICAESRACFRNAEHFRRAARWKK